MQIFSLKRFIVLMSIIIVIVTGWYLLYYTDFSHGQQPLVGVTFSKMYAEYLGLDWQKAYIDILDDLKVKNIRLIAQWDEIEPEFRNYYLDDLDWQITEAERRNIEVILVVGRRVPRWPECHDPSWLKDLDDRSKETEQLRYVHDLIEYFKHYKNIKMWQVENEPFLTSFGKCPEMSIDFIKQEIVLVKSLDNRPILITDSGELSFWLKTSKLADKFGHTLYRVVFNKYIGYIYYYFPASFYRVKAFLADIKPENVIVAELQAEPWVPDGYTLRLDYGRMLSFMDSTTLTNNYNFAKQTGASEIYFWGVEWWYWLKTEKNNDKMWEAAKEILRGNI